MTRSMRATRPLRVGVSASMSLSARSIAPAAGPARQWGWAGSSEQNAFAPEGPRGWRRATQHYEPCAAPPVPGLNCPPTNNLTAARSALMPMYMAAKPAGFVRRPCLQGQMTVAGEERSRPRIGAGFGLRARTAHSGRAVAKPSPLALRSLGAHPDHDIVRSAL